ncbi:acyltransferase [Bosea sp. BK604]|uniref:acyltransferase family protein n=1 Tax=Bosea sp. BK604 TaxID=2512180 RepID=UPI0010EFAD2A|nr:acyltransferase [Bosea sp. BK604]TCR62598.1 peptidoglycan/LPS O-acetylase OafA/YrhL [Bosea sp. BK604]
MQKERRAEIQWLRALAACEVVLCHSFLLMKHISSDTSLPEWYRPFSAIGVELFFVVSGYVICMRVSESEKAWPFLRSRILRLYPMYWVFTSLAVLAFVLNPAWRLHNFDPDLVSLARSYLIWPQMGFPILGVGWTLEHEMIFYVAVAAMLLTLGASTPARLTLAWMLAALGAAGIVLGGIPNPKIAGAPGAGSYAVLNHLFSPFMFAFGFGWLMRVLESMKPVERSLNAFPFAAFALAALWFAPDWGIQPFYRISIAALIFTAFIACRRLFTDNALNRLVWLLGDASFSIYLSHWFVLSAGGKLLGHLHVSPSYEVPIRVIGIVLSIAIGVAVFILVEKPLDRRLRRRTAPALPASKPATGKPAVSAF